MQGPSCSFQTPILATRRKPPDMIEFERTAKSILAPALDWCRSSRRDEARMTSRRLGCTSSATPGDLSLSNGIACSGLVNVGSLGGALAARPGADGIAKRRRGG